jgi:pyrimidine-specific ribonucleoside hydrolase
MATNAAHQLRLACCSALVLGGMLLLAACGSGAPPTPGATDVEETSPSAGSPLPIIIDTDLAADDVLAIMALLREPAVDVRAITIEGNGEAHCEPGMRNLTWLLTQFGADGVPIGCGREEPGPHGRLFPSEWRAGVDDFFGVDGPAAIGDVPAADAVDVLADTLTASDEPLTLVPLGPWTNLADLVEQHPDALENIAGIHAMAAAIDAPGNIAVDDVTPEHGVEWNVGVDPDAFAHVLHETDIPVTLVPLDATNSVPVPGNIAEIIGEDHSAAGADIAHEIYVQSPWLTDGSSFWDTLAALALVDPSLATWEDLTAEVTIDGPSSGDVVRSPSGRPIRAAMDADQDRFMEAMLTALRRGAPRP